MRKMGSIFAGFGGSKLCKIGVNNFSISILIKGLGNKLFMLGVKN